jgi:endonuclease/exonuclease/phosphatase (EEP) superfamily protein YafD
MWASRRFHALIVVVWLAIIGSYLARLHWVCDLTSHFILHYFIAAVIALALFVMAKDRRFSIAAGIAVLVLACRIVPLYIPMFASKADIANPTDTIRLISCNVLTSNDNKQRVIDFVRVEKPDVVLFMEVDRAWEIRLKSLQDILPHGKFLSREDNFGIGMMSRLPFDEIKFEEVGVDVPTVVASVTNRGRRMTFIGTHPPPPVGKAGTDMRNGQFDELVRVVRKQPGPVVLCGDLNCTSWSPYFKDLLREANMFDTRKGYGIQGSWPNWFPVRIAIDHVLVTDYIQTFSRRIGPDIGSDHLPVIIDLKSRM